MSNAPSEHSYHLLTELHDRIADLDVYRRYLAEAKKDDAGEWVTVWQRLIDDAEQQIEFIRAEIEQRSR